jgi:hypothetical protein
VAGSLTIAIVIAATFLWPSRSRASDDAEPVAGVRSTNAKIVAAVQDGLDGSEKFRALIRQIELYQGIVIVEEGNCPRRLRACLLLRVTKAAAFRVLFVHVNLRKASSDLVPLLGHEMMHAVEVLRERAVDTAVKMHHLFARIGVWSDDRMAFETPAATEMADLVSGELQQARAQRAREAAVQRVWVVETNGSTYLATTRR